MAKKALEEDAQTAFTIGFPKGMKKAFKIQA